MGTATKFLQRYLSLNLGFLIILILLRFFEYFYTANLHSLPEGSFALSLTGLLYDLFLFFAVSAVIVIPYLLLCYINQKTGVIFYNIAASVIIAGYISLIHYFAVQQIPLGRDLFAYTTDEIKQTLFASGELNVISFIPFIIFISLFLFLGRLFRNFRYNNFILIIYYLITVISTFLMTSLLIPESSNYKKDLNYYLVNNKMNYFIYDNCFKESSIKANTKGSEDSETNSSVNYLSDEYPFLHIEDTKDVLGQFLNKSSKKPNIVFILTESLSAAFTGRDAYLGSFTPFLDSLIERGLYWKNFLSSSGRTFGVTPAVLGSLPFGNNGFLELGTKAPDHLSIIRLLKENGYYCSFYYGGDPHFDLMDVFLKKENTDFIMQQKDFGSGYVKFPSNSGGFTWGYADREVFRKSFEIMKKSNKEPRLDIYMTLAMHSPFTLPDMAYYVKKSMDRMKTLGLADGEKANEYIKAKEKYACIMYTDDAIRYLINEYKKRDDFKNTIFIITGDHRMVEIPIASKIDKFHVPFIIYSPLVKQKEVFESVSTHQDIAPTLLAFLRDNYNMKFPPKSSWLGQGIDINKSFRNIHTSAFMWDKNDLYSFLDKDYFINDNQLFKLSRNMNIDPITNDTILARLQAKFNKFKEINAYVCENNRLYPDKDPDINTNIKLLQDSKIPKLEESILQSSNPQIFKSSNLIEAYKSIYVLTSFGLSSVPYSPQQMPELSINIFDNKNEKIYTEIIKLKSKGENKSKSGDWQIINIKKYINLSGKNQNVGSYISITLNNINKTKLNLNNLSIKIYGEK